MGQWRSKAKKPIFIDNVEESPSIHSIPSIPSSIPVPPLIEIDEIAIPEVPEPKEHRTLTTFLEISECQDAILIIKKALLTHTPGTLNRWRKILDEINSEKSAFLTIQITQDVFKRLLSAFYESLDHDDSEKVVQMREIIPQLYSKVKLFLCVIQGVIVVQVSLLSLSLLSAYHSGSNSSN
jgi:hypothetical protein